jgi:Protein of unknown function (DUF4058)
MNSPFPGMDPYLEQHWRDVHSRLIIYASDQMQASLPADLLARVEERVYVESGESETRSMYPDVRVVEHGRGGTAVAVQEEIELAEPLIVEVGDESVTETFIEIREAGSGHRLITVIEFISPTNKTPGDGFDLYRQKQKELQRGGVSLVEVDLVRAGKRVLSVPLRQIPYRRRTACQAVVRRGWQWSKAAVYSLPLRKKLPTIGVPLRQADTDVPLNLQALIEQCYRNGRYYSLDYQVEPDPPLTGEDAIWADGLLRSAGLRK